MEIFGFISAIFVGLVLGLIGGGGSILTVPIFVYLFHIDAVQATGFSLFVVGTTSLVGSVSNIKNKRVDFKTALLFGLPSIFGILFSRRLVLPYLPHYIIHRWGITLTKDMLLLILFAVLMLISAYKMIKKINKEPLYTAKDTNYSLLISQGVLVGIVTGLIGAGGGFLIVPALVMLLGLEIKNAIATSLFIISINSLLGFCVSLDTLTVDWKFLGIFTSLSILGIYIGIFFSKKIDGKKLKPLFGWFVLIIGILILIKELLYK